MRGVILRMLSGNLGKRKTGVFRSLWFDYEKQPPCRANILLRLSRIIKSWVRIKYPRKFYPGGMEYTPDKNSGILYRNTGPKTLHTQQRNRR